MHENILGNSAYMIDSQADLETPPEDISSKASLQFLQLFELVTLFVLKTISIRTLEIQISSRYVSFFSSHTGTVADATRWPCSGTTTRRNI